MNAQVSECNFCSIQHLFFESYNMQRPLNSRLDRPGGRPLGFEIHTWSNANADEPDRPQICFDPLGALCHFRRRIGSGPNGRACRAPCPSSGCHTWHRALLMDVCRRDGTRYGGSPVSGRTQSYCTHYIPQFCAAFNRGVPDFCQPRPSDFLSIVSVAHRLAAEPHSVSHAIH